jgi:regulator of protease activity HflC (stomatin/prohibitin superfamily)
MIELALSVLAIAGLALAGFGVFLAAQNVSRNESVRGGVLITVVGVVIAVVFFVMSAGVVEIQPQEVGVVFNVLSGDLADEPLGSGLHIIIPGVQEVTIYSIAQQEYTVSGASGEGAVRGDDAVVALTQDGQQVRLDVTLIYRISSTEVNIVHRNWEQRYVDGLIRPALRNQVRAALTEFRVEQIYGTEHSTLEDAIEGGIRNLIEQEGFTLSQVLIRNISFSQEYVDSIERKQVAQQEAQEAEFRVRERKQEAEQARELARGDADAAEIRAEGDAKALALINAQLSQNPLLLQWRYIEQLGDNVQLMIIPSNSPFLFDLESLTEGGIGPAVVPSSPSDDDAGE